MKCRTNQQKMLTKLHSKKFKRLYTNFTHILHYFAFYTLALGVH